MTTSTSDPSTKILNLKQVGFYGWDQMLILSPTLMNQVHNFVWKHKHKLKGVDWKSSHGSDFLIKGTQKSPGTLSTDSDPVLRVDDVMWYTVTLQDGEVQNGKNKVKFTTWTLRFLVSFEKYQISGEELDMVLKGDLEDLIPWGANIKFQPDAHEETESPPGFAPGVKQDPTPSDAASKLNMTEAQLVQQLASWLDSNRTHTPNMVGPLGMILRLVPATKVGDEKYHFGPTAFGMYLDNTRHNGYLALGLMTQNRPCPKEPPGWSYDLTPSDYSAKLFVSDKLFWKEWFLQRYKQVTYDTQLWLDSEIGPGHVGYNRDHPDKNDPSYCLNYQKNSHSFYWKDMDAWNRAPGWYTEHRIRGSNWGNLSNWDKVAVDFNGGFDSWFDSYGWEWTTSLWLEMRTDDGVVYVTFGSPTWKDKVPSIVTSKDGESLYYTLKPILQAAIKKSTGDLSSFHLHGFYAPGYQNFTAQDPAFIPGYDDSIDDNGRDLTVDLFMNGVPH